MRVKVSSPAGWRIANYDVLPAMIRAQIVGGTAFILPDEPETAMVSPLECETAMAPLPVPSIGRIRRRAAARLQEVFKQIDKSIGNRRRGDGFAARVVG